MVVEYTPGVIQGSMKENGEQTKCMAKGFLVGLTEENITECGLMENNMEKDCI